MKQQEQILIIFINKFNIYGKFLFLIFSLQWLLKRIMLVYIYYLK